MEFKEFNALLRKQIKSMAQGQEYLFRSDVDYSVLWEVYLNSFPPGMNEVFRERREFDCCACRHFIRDFGNVVAIKGGEVISIWDFDAKSEKYQPVVDALSKMVKSVGIRNVFIPTVAKLGVEKNFDLSPGSSLVWYHLYAPLPQSLRRFSRADFGDRQGRMRDVRNVFERSLNEISLDAVDTVLELIAQKSLYKGDEWRRVLTTFRESQVEYSKFRSRKKKSLYCWETSVVVGEVVAKTR